MFISQSNKINFKKFLTDLESFTDLYRFQAKGKILADFRPQIRPVTQTEKKRVKYKPTQSEDHDFILTKKKF